MLKTNSNRQLYPGCSSTRWKPFNSETGWVNLLVALALTEKIPVILILALAAGEGLLFYGIWKPVNFPLTFG